MYIALAMILGAILAAISVISLVKNFLINFNISDNGWKTALIAMLIVICFLCALSSYTEAYTIGDINVMQVTSTTKQEDIEQLKSQIPFKRMTVIVSLCIGYTAFFVHMLLIKNIKNKNRLELETSASRRWSRIE